MIPGRCPDQTRLLEAALDELRQSDAGPLDAHLLGCSRCTGELARLRTLGEDLRAPLEQARPLDDFAAALVGRLPTAAAAPVRRPRVFALAAAAALLLAPATWLALREGEGGTFTARGAGPAHAAAEVLVLRAGRLVPLTAGALRPRERLGVRCSNPGDRRRYLMVFALDAAREVHWLYPAHLDPAADPPSVPLPPGTARVLDEMVEPESPARGPFRLVTLVSDQPHNVRAIEARLAGASPGAPLAPRLPAGAVEERLVTWED